MPIYKVEVIRTSVASIIIEVKAQNERQAAEKDVDKAPDLDFSGQTVSSEYEATDYEIA